MCSRPAVSTMTTSKPVLRASTIAPLARAHRVHLARRVEDPQFGLPPEHVQLLDRGGPPHVGRDEQRVAPLPHQPAPELRRRRRLARALQPEQHDHARRLRRAASARPAGPRRARSSSSRTIFTTCCAGVRLRSTSWPTARSRTRSMKAFTTLKLTSASSNAIRISRSADSTADSDSRASPRKVRNTSWSRLLSESNIRADADLCCCAASARGSGHDHPPGAHRTRETQTLIVSSLGRECQRKSGAGRVV